MTNLDQALRFYQSVLECQPVSRGIYDAAYQGDLVGYSGCKIEAALFQLPGTSGQLEVVQYLNPVGRRNLMETYQVGNVHLCLETDNIEAEFDRLVRIGAQPRSTKPIRIEESRGDVYDQAQAAYFRDPDGISLEVIEIAK